MIDLENQETLDLIKGLGNDLVRNQILKNVFSKNDFEKYLS